MVTKKGLQATLSLSVIYLFYTVIIRLMTIGSRISVRNKNTYIALFRPLIRALSIVSRLSPAPTMRFLLAI
jgi:hypothetical protein